MSAATRLPMALAAVVLLSGCGTPATTPASRAEFGPVASVSTYTANVSPRWTVSIVPDTAGKIVQLNVRLGQSVSRGDVIAELDSRSLRDAVVQAEADEAGAQAKLEGFQAGGRTEDVMAAEAAADAAQAAVEQAQAGLGSATQKLAAAQAGGRPEMIAQARAKLNGDQAALDKLRNGPAQEEVNIARLAVEQAKDKLFADQTQDDALVGQGAMSKEARQAALDVDQTAIDQASAALAKVVSPPRSEDVRQLQAAVDADKQALALAEQPNRTEEISQLAASVAAARAQVAQAQQQANGQRALAAKTAKPYTPQDVTQAQAGLQAAQAVLQAARTALSNATIVAPATGIISDLSVAVGSLASPSSAIATEVALDLELNSEVAQDQVSRFSVGQPASILAGCEQIPGRVVAIAPTADPKTRTFAVKVEPDTSSNALRAGMSVTVQIETGRVDQAIVVPVAAVQVRDGQAVVFKVVDGRAKMTPVQLGLGNPSKVQVTTGVAPDDLVAVAAPGQLIDGQAIAASESTIAGTAKPAMLSSATGPEPAPVCPAAPVAVR